MMLGVLIGSSVLAALLMYLLFKLRSDSRDEGNQLNGLLQIIVLGFIIGLFVIIGQASIDASYECEWHINSTATKYIYENNFSIQNNSHWVQGEPIEYIPADMNSPDTIFLFDTEINHTWSYDCADPRSNAGSTLFVTTTWVARIVAAYILFFVLITIFGYLKDLVKRRGRG